MPKLFLPLILICSSLAAGQNLKSGLDVGIECPAYDPYHVSGPDKSSRACPMCKYGSQQGVMIWVNDPDMKSLSVIAKRMEAEIDSRGIKKFRVFIMYMNPEKRPLKDVLHDLTLLSTQLQLRQVALTCIPSATDPKTAGAFDINPDKRVRNTILVFKKRRVVDKTVNLDVASLDDFIASCTKVFASAL